MPNISKLRNIALAFAMAAYMLCSTSMAAISEELKFVADIPLMPDTELDTLRSVSFDTADGRVFVLFVQMAANDQTVRAFYTETLNALGWEASGKNFVRRGEMLKVKAAPQAGDNVWKLTLSPRPLS